MKKLFVCAILIAVTSQQTFPQESQSLQDKLSLLAGDTPTDRFSPTVQSSAMEYIIGRHLAIKGQHGVALAHYRRAAELDNLASAPWIGMAISLAIIGKSDTSLSAWQEVLLRDPKHREALLLLGLEAARVGDFQRSNQLLARSWVSHNVLPVEALLRHVALARGLFDAGELETSALLNQELQFVFNRSMGDLYGSPTDVWRSLIQQLIDLGDSKVALECALVGVENARNQLKGFLLTAIPVLEAATGGDGQLTIDIYAKVQESGQLGLGPQWSERVNLAQAYSIAGQSMSILGADESAVRLYRQSLSLVPKDALVLNNLAWILMNQVGINEEVRSLCDKAYALDNQSSYILDTVGWSYVLEGNAQKAVELLLGAIRATEQGSAEMYDHLGDAYWLQGETQNAFRAWQTAGALLHADHTRRDAIEGFATISFAVWGITVVSPEVLYDLEVGDLYQRLKEKLAIVDKTTTSKTNELNTNEIGAN